MPVILGGYPGVFRSILSARKFGDMDFIEVTINNWEKYNARKDIKNPWWFKCSNGLLEDPDMWLLDDSELKAWLYILCQCSKQKKKTITVLFDHASRTSNVNISSLKSCIKKLVKKRILEESVRDPYAIRTNHVQQIRLEEKREEESNTCSKQEKAAVASAPDILAQKSLGQSKQPQKSKQGILDIESIYLAYPKKIGKKRGLKALQNAIKTPERLLAAHKALDNYKRYLKAEKKTLQYTKLFSTFVSEIEDWEKWNDASEPKTLDF